MDIGINLSQVTYWATENPFIDRFHTAGTWTAKNSSGTDITSKLTFTSEGDVANLKGVASISVVVGVDPSWVATSKEYVLTYDGTATVKVANGTIVSQSPGKVVLDYTGTTDKPNVYLTFSGLNASDPVSDVHLVRSDQIGLYNSGEIFNPDFVSKVSQWNIIRFMDWGDTNSSDYSTWTTRTTLENDSWSKLTTNDGVPLEAMVKLANEAHVDMWYNVPTKANNTYIQQALTYIRDHLDPALKVHVEYSNEVWNGIFPAYSFAKSKASSLWGSIDHGANVYYGYRSAQIADIAHKVFGSQADDRLVDVLSGQAGNPGLLSYILDGVAKAGVGSASSLFQDYAIAPYFGNELSNAPKNSADLATVLGWVKSGSAGMDAAFHELEYGGSLSTDSSLAVIANAIAKSAAAATAAGLDLVAYEGGASLFSSIFPTANEADVLAFFGKLMNDPRMGELYAKLLADFKAAGGTEFLAFNDVSMNGSSGYWGVLDTIYDSGSARYDALMAAIQSASLPSSGSPSGTGSNSTVPTSGDDVLTATAQGGTLDALAGNDVITAGPASDTIHGGDGDDQINGSSGTTNSKGVLIEADYYSGGAGADTIIGGIGNDHIYGNEASSSAGDPDGADSLSGGAGMDDVRGGAGDDTIDGGDGNDWVYGNDGKDLLAGGAGNDVLRGGGDTDTLQGGAGDDQLFGERGYDELTGGAGNDLFLFGPSQAPFVTTGTDAYRADEITDFTDGADKISLGFQPMQILHGSATTIAAAATWASKALLGHSGEGDVAAVSVGSDTYLFYDDTGKGGTLNAAIRLDQIADSAITTADFV